MTKVLYIAGYGRCGSTVLAAVLGTHPRMVSVGEVSYLFEDWANPRRPCSCERGYQSCEFWQGMLAPGTSDDGVARVVRTVERASFLPRLLLGWVSRRLAGQYRDAQRTMFDHALARSGGSIVVDSSKSARFTVGRSVALRDLAGYDVYFLHLVREGYATLESRVVTGSNWALEGHATAPRLPTLRAVVGWVWSNCCASAMRRIFGEDRYLLLRYEDFLADPGTALRRIGALVGADTGMLIDRIERGQAFEVGHVVGGNRVRFEQAITLRRPKQASRAERLTPRQRLLFSIFGGWLNRRYGYSPDARPGAEAASTPAS